MGDAWNAMADPTRRKILNMLKKEDMNAGEIAEKFNITKPSVSHHLSILKQAELVTSRKEGQRVIYSINTSIVEDLLSVIRSLAQKEEEQ